MKDALAPLDRTTLAIWRTANLAGWAALALGVAFLIHWTASEYIGRYANVFQVYALDHKAEWLTGWGFLRGISLRVGVSVIVALAIGGIVGAKVVKHQPKLAAATAAAYSLITILAIAYYPSDTVQTFRAGPQKILLTGNPLVHGFGGNGGAGWIYDATVLATIPLAALAARFVASRRAV